MIVRLLSVLLIACTSIQAAVINVTWVPTTWAAYYAIDFTGPNGGRLLVTNLNVASFTNAVVGVQYTVQMKQATNWVESGVTNSQLSDYGLPIHVIVPTNAPTPQSVSAVFQEAPELPGPWTTNQILVQNVAATNRSRFYRVMLGIY